MGNEENYKSPFYQERIKEWEEMEILRIWRDAWKECLNQNRIDETIMAENQIIDILKTYYNTSHVEFNRNEKTFKFQFECEEIIL